MQIIQIVSRLPPAIDGVGDYAFLLANQLRSMHDIHTVFVVCDPGWAKPEGDGFNSSTSSRSQSSQGRERTGEIENWKPKIEAPSTIQHQPSSTIDGFPIFQLKGQNAAELLRLLSQPGMPTTVLLQYVGYGYHKRGCAVWLASALHAWKNRKQTADGRSPCSDFGFHPKRRLVTMFHELYASGPVWSSAFWTSPVQKWVVKLLADISEYCCTNLTVNVRTLKRLAARDHDNYIVLPVFSNVGEPENLPGWHDRKPRMIVFGRASQRWHVYFDHRACLEEACRELRLEEIVDIGAPLQLPQLSLRVTQRGIITGPEVSCEMLAASAGFFSYSTAYLGKSGVFAAYAAHGLLPVTFEANQTQNEDALISGQHYRLSNDLMGCDAEKFCANLHRWYQENGSKKHANCFGEMIREFVGDLKV